MMSIVSESQRNVDFASVQACPLAFRTLLATIKPVKHDYDEGAQQRYEPNNARLNCSLNARRRLGPKHHNRGHYVRGQDQHPDDDECDQHAFTHNAAAVPRATALRHCESVPAAC
jgi:hypothetical protein